MLLISPSVNDKIIVITFQNS